MVGEGRGGPGAGPRALFARGPACVLRTLQRLAARPYLGLLFRHGCASAATAGSAAGTGGTGAGESRSLPRRSPAATVAGPRFIPKSRRAGWPRRVTWWRACTMRVPCASGARWPAAIPDGWECVTGRVRHPGARAVPRGRATQGPGHRDPPRYGYKSAGPRRAQGLRGMGARLGACVLQQEPKKRFGPTDPSVFKQPLCHPRLATFPVCRLRLGEERAKKIRLTPSGSPGRPIRGLYGPHTPGTGLWP